MTTGALTLMLITQVSVTIITVYFFIKMLKKSKPKE